MEKSFHQKVKLPQFSDAFNTVFSNKKAFQEYINRREEDRRLHQKQMRYLGYVDVFPPNSYDTSLPFGSVLGSCNNHMRVIPKTEDWSVNSQNHACYINLPKVSDPLEENFLSFIYEPLGPNIPIGNLNSPSARQSVLDSEDVKYNDSSLQMCSRSTSNDRLSIVQQSQPNTTSNRQIPLAGPEDVKENESNFDLSISSDRSAFILEEFKKSADETQNMKFPTLNKKFKIEQPVHESCDVNDNVVPFSSTENSVKLNTDDSPAEHCLTFIPEEYTPYEIKIQSFRSLSEKEADKQVGYEICDTNDKKAPFKEKELKSPCKKLKTEKPLEYDESDDNRTRVIRKDGKSKASRLKTDISPRKDCLFLRSPKSNSNICSQNRLVQGDNKKMKKSNTYEICDTKSNLLHPAKNNCKRRQLDDNICRAKTRSTLAPKESTPRAIENQNQMHPFKSACKKQKLVAYDICRSEDKITPYKIKGQRCPSKKQKKEKTFIYEICDTSHNPESLKIKMVKSKENSLNADIFSSKASSTCRSEGSNPNPVRSRNSRRLFQMPCMKQKGKSVARRCSTKSNLIPLKREESNCKQSKLNVDISRANNHANLISEKFNIDTDKSLKLSFQNPSKEHKEKSIAREMCVTNDNLAPLISKKNVSKERKLKTDTCLAKDNARFIPKTPSKNNGNPVLNPCLKKETEKPIACETCGMRFKFKSQLVIHHRSHTGEKPHKCVTCKRFFSQFGSLYRHRRHFCPVKQDPKLNTKNKRKKSSKKRNPVKIEVITLSSEGE